MPAASFSDPRPIFFNNDGTVCASGTLYYYEPNSLVAKDVYSDADLSTSLGATVELEPTGRTPTMIFLDGDYTCQLKNEDGDLQWTADNINVQGAEATTLPDPSSGEEDDVLSTDGINWLLRAIREVPDFTGQSGKYLSTDGDILQWVALAVYSATNLPGGITQGSTSFQIGKLLVQTGTATLPTAAGNAATVAVTFGTAYATFIGLIPVVATSSGSTSQGGTPILSYSGNTTGATIRGYAGDEHEAAPNWHLSSTTPIFYVAFGLVA